MDKKLHFICKLEKGEVNKVSIIIYVSMGLSIIFFISSFCWYLRIKKSHAAENEIIRQLLEHRGRIDP